MKACVSAFLLLTLTVVLSANPYAWRTVQSSSGQFRADFPGPAKQSQEPTTDVIDGSKFVSHRLASSPKPGVVYAVSWWENPRQAKSSNEELFVHFRDCDLKSFQGNVVREERLKIKGFPADDFEIANTKGGFSVQNRIVRVRTHVYSLWVIEPSGQEDRAAAKKFLNSFELLPEHK